MAKENEGPVVEKVKQTTILRKKNSQGEIRKENGEEISVPKIDTPALNEQEKKDMEERLQKEIRGFLAQKYKKQ